MDQNPSSSGAPSPTQDTVDTAQTKDAQQNERLQKQLKVLQTEEKALNSILLELRSQSRKLNLEKYRLLELVKEKQEVQQPPVTEVNIASSEDPENSHDLFGF